ncbi:MAG: M15 family metallopeptidase [Steroidobacteraceae bacterium]
MNEFEITGLTDSHIVKLGQPNCALHYEVVSSYLAMADAARLDGIALQPCSAYRSFASQLQIWNRKWRGERPLYGRDGLALNYAELSPDQLLEAILTWSAIPGGSRHHWGSDLDLIDTAAVPAGYTVQLIPAEYATDGVFARLTGWLNQHAIKFGFFRPYRTDRGGVIPEPWHFSYAPVSLSALESLSLAVLRRVLEQSEMAGKQLVLSRLPEIYTRFLLAVDSPV